MRPKFIRPVFVQLKKIFTAKTAEANNIMIGFSLRAQRSGKTTT